MIQRLVALWRRTFGRPAYGWIEPPHPWPRPSESIAADEQAMRDAMRDAMRSQYGCERIDLVFADPPKLEVYRTRDGRYKWRTRGVDGTVHRISTMSYGRRRDAIRGYRRATR